MWCNADYRKPAVDIQKMETEYKSMVEKYRSNIMRSRQSAYDKLLPAKVVHGITCLGESLAIANPKKAFRKKKVIYHNLYS